MIFKALSINGSPVTFKLSDCPVIIYPNVYALLQRPDTPLILGDTIVRGSSKYNLFEGDYIKMQDSIYLVCYERGFYCVNEDMIIKNFNTLEDYQVVEPPVNFNVQRKVKKIMVFKYDDIFFTFADIVGAYGDKLILRQRPEPVHPKDVHLDAGIRYKRRKVYIGDIINDHEVELVDGRITLDGVDLVEVKNDNN